jgi:hypothetical protein
MNNGRSSIPFWPDCKRSNMFDLEQSVAKWRQQMLAAGIKSPVPLEELESHLREEFERQKQSGLRAQQAFEIAVGKIGQAPELKREFKKVSAPMEIQRIIKLAGISCVVVALFVQLCICFPAWCHIMHDQRLSLTTRVLIWPVWAMTLAITVLSWKYNHKLLPVIRNQRLRRAVGMACFAGCLLWIRLVLFHLPIGAFKNEGFGQGGILLLVLIFGLEWTVIAILGGVGHGLEKAVHGQTTVVDS